jgi:ATP-dependent DNA helicase Q1
MKNVFNIKEFRFTQEEIINATIDKQDCFVIMPTGTVNVCLAADRLQAAARAFATSFQECLALASPLCAHLLFCQRSILQVISPLISLMQDQVMGLRAIGIPCELLTGTTSKDEIWRISSALESPDVHEQFRFLYVTPEKIAKNMSFLKRLEKVDVLHVSVASQLLDEPEPAAPSHRHRRGSLLQPMGSRRMTVVPVPC